MSSGFDVIRKHSSDPHALRIKSLAAELAKSKNEASGRDLESDDVRSQGRMDHSTVKFDDERLKFVFPINASLDNYFEHPTEPDFDKLKLWFMLDHLGTKIRDMSGFQHHGFLKGHPTLHRAPLNLGYLQTSAAFGFPAMSFNTGQDIVGNYNGEHIQVIDNTALRFAQYPAGFSICFRFKCVDFSRHQIDEDTFNFRRFATKTDDESNGWVIGFSDLGDIDFHVTHNGIVYKQDYDALNLDTWYQVACTYDPNAGATSEDRIKIYVGNNEGSTTAGNTLALNPITRRNLYIGALYSQRAFFRGFIQDFRIYMNKVLTPTEVVNFNTNEITIDDIPKGRVFVVQYALVWQSMALKIHKFNNVGVILPISKTKTHKYNLLNPMAPVLKTHRYKNVITKIHKFNTGGPFSGTKTHKFHTIKAIGVTTKTHKYNTTISIGTTTKTHKFHTVNTIESTTKTHKFNTIVTLTSLTQVVRFQKNSSGTNGVTQDVTFTFTPKAIIVMSDGNTVDNTQSPHYQWIQGFSDGTNHTCIAGTSTDSVADSLTGRIHRNDSVFVRMSETAPSTTILSRASCSFGTNKVTFTWTVNDTAATYITVWAIGGTAITNTKVNTVDVGRTTTGTQDYTGLGFTPTDTHGVLFTLCSSLATLNTLSSSLTPSFGCATSSSKRWAMTNIVPNAQPTSSTLRRFSIDNCLLSPTTSGTVSYSADFDNWISDGFRLDYTDAPPSSTDKFSYLVIKGGNWDNGTHSAPSTPTNDRDVTVVAGSNSIKGLYVGGVGLASAVHNTTVTEARYVHGVTDGTTKAIIAANDENAQSTMDNQRLNNVVNIVRLIGTNGANVDVATFDSFGTNTFRLDWSAVDGGFAGYNWVIVADQS